MKLYFSLTVFCLAIFLTGCDEERDPRTGINKTARIEFFAASDFSDPKYDDYYVQFSAAVMKMTYEPYATEYFLEETTGWIAFKDIPTAGNRMVFEVVVPDVQKKKQGVVMGYSYVIKIGEYSEFHSRSEYVDSNKSAETLQAIF
jgi:hypothetical protein